MSLPYSDLGKAHWELLHHSMFCQGRVTQHWGVAVTGAGIKARAVPNLPDQMWVLIKELGHYCSTSTERVQIIKCLLIPHYSPSLRKGEEGFTPRGSAPALRVSHLDVEEGLGGSAHPAGMFLLQDIHPFLVRLSWRRFLPLHCAK